MDYTLADVENEIERIYKQAAENARPLISRLDPDEGVLGFWWSKFDQLVTE